MRHFLLSLCAGVALWAQEDIIRRAVAAQQAGRFVDAADAYQEALRLNPNDVASHVNLGVVLVRLGRFDAAIVQYQAAEKLLPGDARIGLNLALAYEKSGRVTEAVRRFEALHASNPGDLQVTMLLADCRLQLGEDARVINLLTPLQNADNPAIAYMLGMALLREKRFDEGQVLLDRILRGGDSAEARFLLGTRMFQAADYPAAVKQLAGAIELNPDLPQVQAFYGRALLYTGDAGGAQQAFEHELKTNPNDFAANAGLADILNARGACDPAMEDARRALELRPGAAQPQFVLGSCLAKARQFAKSVSYAEAAAKAMPKSADAHRLLATVYTGLDRTKEAAAERRVADALAVESDPGPVLGRPAPEFSLTEAGSGRVVQLADFRGRSPVVLIFGSYSCPNFRSAAGALKDMQSRYGAQVSFLLIYVREAHAGEQWQSTRNAETFTAARDIAEKQDHATKCLRALHLSFPALVDGMDGAVESAYRGWPSRAFVVGRDGRLLYSTRLDELNFRPAEMETAIARSRRQ